MPDVIIPVATTTGGGTWFPGMAAPNFAMGLWPLVQRLKGLVFKHKALSDHTLTTGENLDLGIDAGDDFENPLVRLVVVAGDGTILAFRQDHAREGTR
jgi:hypothetical protein